MSDRRNQRGFDVVGIGNAIVDVLSPVEESFIQEHQLTKGNMTLIEADRAQELYEAMPPGKRVSGGSAANTMVGVACLQGSAAYIGKVNDDPLGNYFSEDIRGAGVNFRGPIKDGNIPTARCLIQVTPDAQRTMNTFLGVSSFLDKSEIDEDLVASSDTLYCEGYLWDRDVAKEAIRFAMGVAKKSSRKVALTLSDEFCVDRHREEWLDLLEDRVDIVFSNESETKSLFETKDFSIAIKELSKLVDVAFVTLGPRGSLVIAGKERIEIPAEEIGGVIDTTGAGDLYASGVLFGLSQGFSLEKSGKIGSIAAAEVISHLGPRPETDLIELVEKNLN